MGMINLLVEKRKMTRLDAYGLTSIAGDCRLGATSDAEKNVHCLTPKRSVAVREMIPSCTGGLPCGSPFCFRDRTAEQC